MFVCKCGFIISVEVKRLKKAGGGKPLLASQPPGERQVKKRGAARWILPDQV